jgi:hypothetical protein
VRTFCDTPFGYAPDHAPVLRGVAVSIPPVAMVALAGADTVADRLPHGRATVLSRVFGRSADAAAG